MIDCIFEVVAINGVLVSWFLGKFCIKINAKENFLSKAFLNKVFFRKFSRKNWLSLLIRQNLRDTKVVKRLESFLFVSTESIKRELLCTKRNQNSLSNGHFIRFGANGPCYVLPNRANHIPAFQLALSIRLELLLLACTNFEALVSIKSHMFPSKVQHSFQSKFSRIFLLLLRF